MSDSLPPALPSVSPPPLPAGPMVVRYDQAKIDAAHLRLLVIFHGVLALLGILMIGGLVWHHHMMMAMFTGPDARAFGPDNAAPAPEFFEILEWVYVGFGAVSVFVGLLNAVSAWCIGRRRVRTYSLIIAGLDCLLLPYGTVLGVFTFMVLGRDSVRQVYEGGPPSATLPAPAG